MKDPRPPGRGAPSPAGRASAWLGRAALAAWLAAVGLWVQFALASAEELEPQAAALGWILVVILLVGGATVWAAHRASDED